MKIYKQRKKYIILLAFVYIFILIPYGLFLYTQIRSMSLQVSTFCGGIAFCSFAFALEYQDYKTPLVLGEKSISFSCCGNMCNYLYEDICTIRYKKGNKFYLDLRCQNGENSCIKRRYENSSEVWRDVILQIKAKNPNVQIDPKLQKRLGL